MHAAGDLAGMRKRILFAHGQCVHVCTQPDAARAVPHFQHADHTMPTHVAMHFIAQSLQLVGYQGRRIRGVAANFRRSVDLPAQHDELIQLGS
ncbi:hypothetical protein D3C75_1172850 [compost metagenome]